MTPEELHILYKALNGKDATASMLQSDINRGVLPGKKTPESISLTPGERALVDRYAWGKQAGIGGIPVAMYSELLKVPAVRPLTDKLTHFLGKLTGIPEADEWTKDTPESSPPSLANIGAYILGSAPPIGPMRGIGSGLMRYFGE